MNEHIGRLSTGMRGIYGGDAGVLEPVSSSAYKVILITVRKQKKMSSVSKLQLVHY